MFKSAPDLLDEFKQFLPDHSAQAQEAESSSAQAAISQSGSAARKSYAAANALSEAVNGAAAAAANKIKSNTNKAGPPSVTSDELPPPPITQTKRKREPAQQASVPPQPTPPTVASSSRQKGTSGKTRGKGAGAAAGVKDPPTMTQQSSSRLDALPGALPGAPGYPAPLLSYLPPGYTLPGTAGTGGTIAQGPPPQMSETVEERAFFDRIAEFIDDKFTYYQFLKLLNLWTQDIIDLPTLVSRAWLFLGPAPDLWMDFREIVGWRDGVAGQPGSNGRTIENGEWIVENVPAVDRKTVDLTKCESAGPSYRKLPKSVSMKEGAHTLMRCKRLIYYYPSSHRKRR